MSTQLMRASRRRRERRVVTVLAMLVLGLAALSLSVGDFTLSLPEVVQTLLGGGGACENFIVLTLRLPRPVLAAVAGVAFALSGAIFQTVLRNPLASPDVIGVTGGASAAAVFGMLILGLGSFGTSVAAFTGAMIVAAAIYVLAFRGGIAGYRFVLIGVGLAFMAQGVLGYLLSRADIRNAQQALVWLVGSVSGASWNDIFVITSFLLLLLPITALLSRPLSALQVGDATAAGWGVHPERVRLFALIIAVALASVATAMVGPLAFVAFVSAPIARSIVRTGSLALIPAALVGAIVVVTADFAAQHLLPGGLQLPAGIMTGAIGAPYLLWLLASSNRRGKGG